MRVVRYALVAALALPCMAPLAASGAVFEVSGLATGSTLTRVCTMSSPPCDETISPDQQSLFFWLELASDAWTQQDFTYYNPIDYASIKGTVVNLGNGAFRGENLTYYSDHGTGRQCAVRPTNCIFRETRLSASGFGVLQVSPPVPEPATWALMILGFGAAGWALRRRKATVRLSPAA